MAGAQSFQSIDWQGNDRTTILHRFATLEKSYRKIEEAEKCEEGSSEQPRWAKPGRTRLAHYLAAAPKVLPKIWWTLFLARSWDGIYKPLFLGLMKNDETVTLGKGSNCRNILNQWPPLRPAPPLCIFRTQSIPFAGYLKPKTGFWRCLGLPIPLPLLRT